MGNRGTRSSYMMKPMKQHPPRTIIEIVAGEDHVLMNWAVSTIGSKTKTRLAVKRNKPIISIWDHSIESRGAFLAWCVVAIFFAMRWCHQSDRTKGKDTMGNMIALYPVEYIFTALLESIISKHTTFHNPLYQLASLKFWVKHGITSTHLPSPLSWN